MDEAELRILTQSFGLIPPELLELYGAPSAHPGHEYIRLMPPRELISETKSLNSIICPVVGRVIWAWTDDNSNYLGVCLEDPLKGWVIALQHDGDSEVPYFRSINNLMTYLRENPEDDILLLEGEFPVQTPSFNLEADRKIVQHFKEKWQEEETSDRAGKLAIVAIQLTPVEDTEHLLDFLYVDDMWVPSEAISLLRKRKFRGGFKQMEDLASEGTPNGNLGAIHYLKEFAPKDSLLRVRDRLIKRSAEGDQLNKRCADFALQQLEKLL